MNKIYTLLCLCFLSFGIVNAQATFNDDFEAYSVNDYLGSNSAEWSTWSGTEGGAEDVRITNNNASSGTNSIYFSSTAANGGPVDVVLPFGGVYNSGIFTYSMNVYVEEGAGAYWNFQGNNTIGDVYSHNCYMLATGEVQFSNSDNQLALGATYPQGEWVNISYNIDLTKNSWQISLNGECLGSFSNGANSVASIDLYPTNGNKFYVDDVAYTYNTESAEKQYDAALTVNALDAGGLTGMEQEITGVLTNIGTDMINSAEVVVTTNDGESAYLLDNLSLTNGQTYEFSVEELYALKEGNNAISVEVRMINQSVTDQEPCNSKYSAQLVGVTPAVGKNIIVEEGTGTWCGWCPRGAVFLDNLTAKYADRFIGVAVHNGDPMVVSGYDGQHGFAGYPSATVMRKSADGSFGTQSDLELPFLEYIAQAPLATFEIGAQLNAESGLLDISVDVSANAALTTSNKIALIITEDGVTGTTNDYAQSNYYAGGNNGAMGGYESLPGTVPASDMVYDHVARAIPLGFGGDANSFTNNMAAGETRTFNYSYTIPATYDMTKMHIVAVILDGNNQIDNGQSSSVEGAIQRGFTLTSTDEPLVASSAINLFPNPTQDMINVSVEMEDNATVQAQIINALGQVQSTENVQLIKGSNTYRTDVSQLAAGTYYVVLRANDKSNVLSFVKN